MRFFKLASLLTLLSLQGLKADSTYDWLAGTEWYVPAANLLAYATSTTDLSTPLPIGDQTLWTINTSTNGNFTGISDTTLNILGHEQYSTSQMNGYVTPGGQIRILFTQGETQTVGIGQFRPASGGGQYAEMQMMTGAGAQYVTHWAYMAQNPGGSFTPASPPQDPEGNLLSEEWKWMKDTTWILNAPESFGSETPQFHVTDYRNGYFWGEGGESTNAFSLIGSVTPEGNVLFNFLRDGTLTNLTGQISGGPETGNMFLRGYQGTNDFGQTATAQIVPEPTPSLLLLLAGILCFGFQRRSSHQRTPIR